jgi:hypothetical protein
VMLVKSANTYKYTLSIALSSNGIFSSYPRNPPEISLSTSSSLKPPEEWLPCRKTCSE